MFFFNQRKNNMSGTVIGKEVRQRSTSLERRDNIQRTFHKELPFSLRLRWEEAMELGGVQRTQQPRRVHRRVVSACCLPSTSVPEKENGRTAQAAMAATAVKVDQAAAPKIIQPRGAAQRGSALTAALRGNGGAQHTRGHHRQQSSGSDRIFQMDFTSSTSSTSS